MTRSLRALFLASIACLLVAVVVRPLWYDEILGHWMSTLAWPGEVRAATRAGIDLQPPAWYLLVNFSEVLTGGPRGPRVLALIGIVAAALLVGRLARERWGTEIGIIASAALLTSGAHEYAWEGRPYGLLLGCSALAFFAWCRVADGQRRALWLLVLCLALFAAVQLHYFAVLLWFPIGVGELVRTRARGRLDLAVLAVCAVPLLPLLLLMSDARSAGELMRLAPFSSPSVKSLGNQYKSLLALPLSAMIAIAVMLACRDGLARFPETARGLMRDPRKAAIAAFLLLPAAAMLLTVLGGSGISHQRYSLALTLGASLTTAGLVHALRLEQPTLRRVVWLAAFLTFFVCARDAHRAWDAASKLDPMVVLHAPAGVPQVYPSGTDGLEFWQVSDAATRAKMLLAADPRIAAANDWYATVDINLAGARGFFPFPVASWNDLRALRTDFVLVQQERSRTWVLDEVLRCGARIESLPTKVGWEAWLVRLPESAPQPSVEVRRSAAQPSTAGG